MLHSYLIRVTIDKTVDEYNEKKFSKLMLKLNDAYEKLLAMEDNFPRIGVINKTKNGMFCIGYDYRCSLVAEQMVRFTSQFPKRTFRVYYSYFDFVSISAYELIGNKIRELKLKIHDPIALLQDEQNSAQDATLNVAVYGPDNLLLLREVTTYINRYYMERLFDYYKK